MGFLNAPGEKADLTDLKPVLQHRGPDGIGYFQDDFLSLVHWRLAIIDLSAKAAQPFIFEQFILVFNGELYNYREVAAQLKKEGYAMTTNSDTEVVVKAFHCWGEKSVDRFIGMFAFVVYDRSNKEVHLFRDRMGVKPLYYSLQGGLSFGSEMKVFRSLNQSLTIDRYSLRQYFRFGYSPGERTIFKEVKKLLPGHHLKYSGGSCLIRSYWSIPKPSLQLQGEKGDLIPRLEQTLTEAFQYRMVSDVPVGVFLSGGVDSSLVATLLQRNNTRPIKTFTIGFDEQAFDEMPFARTVAERLGTDHVDFRLHRSEAREMLLNFYDVYDEPFSDASGIPTALIALLARQHGVKVVLSADGADELFGGYPHYQRVRDFQKRAHLMPGPVRKVAGSTLGILSRHVRKFYGNLDHRLPALGERLVSSGTAGLFESSCANQAHLEIDELMGESFVMPPLLQVNEHVDPILAMMYWDAKYYLPDDLLMKVDRATMKQSVEGRDPFLDHRVVEIAQRLPVSMKVSGRESKIALRRILYQYHPSFLFDRPKQGFTIPLFAWFQGEFDSLFDRYLTARGVVEAGLNPDAVARERKKYEWCKKSGKQYNMEKMWRVLSFMMWFERWGK